MARGVRQGDPFANLLFILSLKVFFRRLNNNQNFRDKKTAYADDITCFCSDLDSVKRVFTYFSVQYGIHEDEWSQKYLLPFHCAIEIKMRVFQFKFCIIFFTPMTIKMRQVETELCTFCEIAVENPVHIFWDCKTVEDLRQAFVDEFGLRLCVTFEDLTKKKVMFGFIKDWKGPYMQLLNHLILLFKRYIYIQRCKKSEVSLGGLIVFIGSVRYT